MEEMNNVSSVVTEKEGGARLETAAPSKTPMTGGKKAALVIGILLGVLVLAYLAACVVVQTVYGGTALPRTDVLGVDVSKMTEQEIVALWEKQGVQTVRDTKVSLTENDADIGSVSLEELGVTVTPEAAAVAAGASRRYESWGGGALAWLRGGWEYIHSWFAQTSAVPSFDVDSAALDTACEKLSASLNCTVVDGGYRLEKGEGLYITKPADGRMLDAPKLERDLTAMLQSGALTPVACVYEEKKAETVDVQALHDQLAGEKAEAVCNEEFWYNSTVGQRTAARGYHEAGVYEAGRTTTGIGGGICQVSSTLYYAVMLSDLDIVLRYCHMFNPGYLPIGCDATVSWGGPDFAFRNSRDYPIKVVTSYNDNTNELTCTILGTKVDDHYVVITNAVLASYDYQVVYQESPDVAPGDEVIDQYGHTGYFVRTWRNIYDGNDNLLSSRVEADSHYDVGNKIILVAPGYLPDTGE